VELAVMADEIQVTVADDGQGIEADFLPYVFDRFRQADSSFARTHGGLGLGMAIVRHLVELHGGAITVASPGKDRGTTFVVMLPARVPAADAVPRIDPRAVPRDATPELPVSLAGVSVLIVDDEAETRELLRAILTQRGAKVKSCASAAEALNAIAEWKPAVMVADIGMPGEDGYELIRKLRLLDSERGGSVPAVALTAYARSEDRTRVLAAGFQMHVSKPVEALELIMVIASLADRKAMKA